MSFDLDSPVGRRAVEAGRRALCPPNSAVCSGTASEVIQAALEVLTSDTCQTCRGLGRVPTFPTGTALKPCPDCDDGHIRPALYTPEYQDRIDTAKDDYWNKVWLERKAELRAKVVAEIVAYMREPDLDSIAGHAATKAWADRIERREWEK